MISRVSTNNKKKSRTDRLEDINAARMSAACEGLTERNFDFHSLGGNENENKSGQYGSKIEVNGS